MLGLLAGLRVETDERVDLEIVEVEVDIDGVETKLDEAFALFDGHVDEKSVGDGLAGLVPRPKLSVSPAHTWGRVQHVNQPGCTCSL